MERLKIYKNEICWPIVFLYMLGGLTNTAYFLILIAVLALIALVKYRGVIPTPRIPGVVIYIMLWIISALVGILSHSLRSVLRDLFYVLPSVVAILVGYYLAKIYSVKVWKTVCLMQIWRTILIAAQTIVTPSAIGSFAGIRGIFGENLYEICFFFPIFLYKCYFENEITLSRKADLTLSIVWGVQIFLSMGRTAWVAVLLMFATIFLMDKRNNNKMRIWKNVAVITCILMIIIAVSIRALPQTIIESISYKVLNSFTELSSDQYMGALEYDGSSWRAYEIAEAKSQWLKANILAKIFGHGLGHGIELGFIPASWKNWLGPNDNGIPLLHNAFYTLLPKVGIIGVAVYTWFHVVIARAGLKSRKDNRNYYSGIYLAALAVSLLCISYFNRGIVGQYLFLTWCILVGYFCERIANEHEQKDRMD